MCIRDSKCTAPDPYDPLRGRYLAVRPSQTEAPVPAGMVLNEGTQVYAVLTPGADGFAIISSLSLTPPEGGDYVRVKSRYVFNEKAVIDWPFDRFYVNEKPVSYTHLDVYKRQALDLLASSRAASRVETRSSSLIICSSPNGRTELILLVGQRMAAKPACNGQKISP